MLGWVSSSCWWMIGMGEFSKNCNIFFAFLKYKLQTVRMNFNTSCKVWHMPEARVVHSQAGIVYQTKDALSFQTPDGVTSRIPLTASCAAFCGTTHKFVWLKARFCLVASAELLCCSRDGRYVACVCMGTFSFFPFSARRVGEGNLERPSKLGRKMLNRKCFENRHA